MSTNAMAKLCQIAMWTGALTSLPLVRMPAVLSQSISLSVSLSDKTMLIYILKASQNVNVS